MKRTSRVTRSKTQARTSYNRLSRWYDFLAGSSEEKFRLMGIRSLSVCPGEKVLEIGFGTGTSLVALGDQVSVNGRIYGVDLSEGMASVAQDRIRRTRNEDKIALSLADGTWLPFRSGYFEAVLMSFTLELFDTPEIPLVLSQCMRILKPKGRLSIVGLQKSPSPGFPERVYEWCHARMPVLVDCRPIDVETCVEQGGFTITSKVLKTMWGLPVAIVTAVSPLKRKIF